MNHHTFYVNHRKEKFSTSVFICILRSDLRGNSVEKGMVDSTLSDYVETKQGGEKRKPKGLSNLADSTNEYNSKGRVH